MAVKASWSRNFIHSFTPFHSPSIDKWLGQGASACPWPPGGHVVRECPSAANSLYISIPQQQVWTSKKIKAGASTAAPVLAHGHPGAGVGGNFGLHGGLFMLWDHYWWREAACLSHGVFSSALGSKGRRYHHPNLASYCQAGCCLSSRKAWHTEREMQRTVRSSSKRVLPYCSTTCFHLPSFCPDGKWDTDIVHVPGLQSWHHLGKAELGLFRYGRVKACPVLLVLHYYHFEKPWRYRKSVRMLQLSRPTFGSHYRE